jgi:hypothetical protein
LDYRWLTALSIIGILIGVLLFVYESFTVVTCMCPLGVVNCTCQMPFSVYLYGYYLPAAIISVSTATLILSLRRQWTLKGARAETA